MKPHHRFLVLFAFALLSARAAFAEPATVQQPNVIIIYTDDQGSVDMNAYGSKDLITPNMDDLARRGVRFTQMYAPSAICSSSRAGLMTGRFPVRAGVPGNVSSMEGHDGMPSSEITIAEMMHKHGYATGHIGKWHLGYTPTTMPNGQGYDYSFGHMGGCIDNYSHFFFWKGPNRHDLWRNGKEIWRNGEFFIDMMVEECNAYIERHAQQRFFVYWAINTPHYPLQGTPEWLDRYSNLEDPRRQYAAFLSTTDAAIGQVIAKLDALNLREKTVVIFQSDHGHSTEERTFFGGGSAGPYRGAKGCLFEGGIRVPSIVSQPGRLPENVVRDQMVTGCDWFPTIAALCGLSAPPHHLDGRNITPVIRSSEAASPHMHFHWHLGGSRNPQWVVRKGDWKLLGNANDRSNTGTLTADDKKLFLTNLRSDIGERTNVADEHPEVVRELLQMRKDFEAGIASRNMKH